MIDPGARPALLAALIINVYAQVLKEKQSDLD